MQPFAFTSGRLGNSTVANLDSDGVQYLVAFETSGTYALVRAWVNVGGRLARGDATLYHAKGRPSTKEVSPWAWD